MPAFPTASARRPASAGRVRTSLPAVAADLVVVLAFVAIGRHTHDHGVSLRGMASTTWPFACGLAVGWAGMAVAGRSGRRIVDGAAVAVATVAVGMVLRVAAGQGTAVAFVVVALVFNGLVMAAWRAVAGRIRGRRGAATA